jgi:hypothetical protein
VANKANEARAGLVSWGEEFERSFERLVEVLGAPVAESRRGPALLVPYLDEFLSGLPFDRLDEEDWVVLEARLVAYLAQLLNTEHSTRWDVREDANNPEGFRYVLRLTTPTDRWVDPFAVVANELHNRPVEVTRMLATAELAIGVALPDWDTGGDAD